MGDVPDGVDLADDFAGDLAEILAMFDLHPASGLPMSCT
jgi:hypothetical protein